MERVRGYSNSILRFAKSIFWNLVYIWRHKKLLKRNFTKEIINRKWKRWWNSKICYYFLILIYIFYRNNLPRYIEVHSIFQSSTTTFPIANEILLISWIFNATFKVSSFFLTPLFTPAIKFFQDTFLKLRLKSFVL